MKIHKSKFSFLLLLVLLIVSCEKEYIREKKVDLHPILWDKSMASVKVSSKQAYTTIGEDNSVFVFTQKYKHQNSNLSSIVSAFDENGNSQWEKQFTGASASALFYTNEKLIFITSGNEFQGTPSFLYIVDSHDGTIISEHNTTNQYNNYEFCTSKLVVKDEIVFLLIENENSKLIAFNIQGDELFQEALDYQGVDIQIDDNKLYISAYSTIYGYSYSENTLSFDWSWNQPENFHISSIRFDQTHQLLFECSGSIYILSQAGNYIKTLTFPGISIDFFQITPDDKLMFGNNDLYKYDMDGKLIWKSHVGHNSLSNNFNAYQTISEEGYIYSAQTYGLIAMDPLGEFIWYEDSGIRKIAPPVLDKKQNIICTNSYQNRIVCIKGDAVQ